MSKPSVLILAAGKGVRMKSSLPKVLHALAGVPVVERVCRTLARVQVQSLAVVVGHQGARVQAHLKKAYPKTSFYTQRVLNGSGGAVKQSLSWLKKVRGDVLVTCGDMPLLSQESFKTLIQLHRKQKNAATVLTAKMANPYGYGRIVRKRDGSVLKIAEELDATPKQRQIKEVNTATYCFNAAALRWALPRIKNNNAKKEYYLTDVLELLRQKGGRVGAVACADERESLGINSRQDLARAHAYFYQLNAERLMAAGVTLLDPSTTFVDDTVKVAPDVVIWPQTFIVGSSRIGSGSQVGPWTFMKDTKVENDAIIQASFLDSGIVRKGARVGPYSRVRPKSDLGPNVHLGNFSEVKNTHLKAGAKVNHLSYLGDAKVGKNVNIGAGTITCNYDGFQKHPTTIQDHAFIGSNANLVAPLTIGAHSVVGAGSSLNQNVPAWSLAVERAPTKIKKGWAKQQKRKQGKKKKS